MKKSVVVLLLGLALIVLVSPGIVGRLAEKSMDENLDWAATEAQEVVVSSQGFDRGWFSSAGQHRIEIRDGDIRDLLLTYAGADGSAELPALIIDTRIDHGLIPVTSLAREKGSLVPGLGSAVSTLSIETGGQAVPLPGKIYSVVGLTGELQSNYVLEPGSFEHDGATARWGDVDITVSTSPTDGLVAFDGAIASFAVDARSDNVRIDDIRFAGEQAPSGFGFRVGPIAGSIGSIRIDAAPPGLGGSMSNEPYVTIGPIAFDATSSIDGDRVTARSRLDLRDAPLEDLGPAGIVLDLRLVRADARALGGIMVRLENLGPAAGPDAQRWALERDAKALVAAGLELHVDEATVSLPQGRVEATLHVTIDETDSSGFTWPQGLLAVDASADFRIAEPLVQLAMAANPEVGGLIGMGYLRKNGDVYELRAEFSDGLLTVNGAPIPIPLTRLQ